MHQQSRVAGAPVGRRGVGDIIEKGAEDAGGLVKRRRSTQHAATVVVAVGLLLTDHTGVVSESTTNAIAEVETRGRLDRTLEIGPVVHEVPGHGTDVHSLRVRAIDCFKGNRSGRGHGDGTRAGGADPRGSPGLVLRCTRPGCTRHPQRSAVYLAYRRQQAGRGARPDFAT